MEQVYKIQTQIDAKRLNWDRIRDKYKLGDDGDLKEEIMKQYMNQTPNTRSKKEDKSYKLRSQMTIMYTEHKEDSQR